MRRGLRGQSSRMVMRVEMRDRCGMGQGMRVRGRGVVGDVRDGHGGGRGDQRVVHGRRLGVDGVNRMNWVNRVNWMGRVVAAVVGYDDVMVGGVVRHRGGDERYRSGRWFHRVDDRMD